MGFLAENEHLVPEEDKFYFGNATVKGLREQLRENGLSTSGRKYELYRHLLDNGLRMYTDDRPDDIDSESDEESGSDEEESQSDEEDEDIESDEEADYTDDDAGSTDDEGSEEGDEQSGDDQEADEQGGDPPEGGKKKRPRDEEDDQSPSPPKAPRLGSIPAEIQLQIMQDLNPAQLWNLAMASPEGYLGESINIFLLDAYRQLAIDYPDAYDDGDDGGEGDDGGGDSDGGSSGSEGSEDSEESDSDDSSNSTRDRPLSLLEWVGRRVIYDSAFRAAYGARISQLIDTYLQVYGQDNPAVENENVIEDILWYFRPQQGMPPIIRAAVDNLPDVVHLLLLRGADVNQPAYEGSPNTALSQATSDLNTTPEGVNGMQTVFALIGAGADVTNLPRHTRAHARRALSEFMDYVPARGEVQDYPWPRIINLQGLSAREFIADERSDYFDRIILAMFAIHIGSFDYPGFV